MSVSKQVKKQISHDIAIKVMEWKLIDDRLPYYEDQFGKKHRHFNPLDSLEDCFLILFKLKEFFLAGRGGNIKLQDTNISEKIEDSRKFRYFITKSICQNYKIAFDVDDSFYKETLFIPSFEDEDEK